MAYYDYTAIACEWGHTEAVQYLLHRTDSTLILKGERNETSKYLLSLNCSVNVQDVNGTTPLHKASMNFNVEIIKLLLERDGTLLNQQDKDGRTPLHCVFEHVACLDITRYETVSCLLNFPECDINLTDNKGNTPFHLAARCRDGGDDDDDDKILPLFIQQDGLQLNVQNDKGQTALHLAARYCDSNEIKVLLSHKECKVNTQDKNGDTPLHSCIQSWRNGEKIKSTMIDFNKHDSSILNIKNNKGQTPLHKAVEEHEFEAVDLLVRLGAEVNIKDNDNRTPLELALGTDAVMTLVNHWAIVFELFDTDEEPWVIIEAYAENFCDIPSSSSVRHHD
ncbi:hypothetical protein B566_EDAN014793 [Ephemera danica]|nr:hypothetical protein B566_EDAN014793 [Ephemera danica]